MELNFNMAKLTFVDALRRDELFQAVVHEDRFIMIRGLLLAVALTGFIPIFKSGFYFGCELMLLQAVLLPFLMTVVIFVRSSLLNRQVRALRGAVVGALVGGIPFTISALISNVRYYFFGGQQTAAVILSRPIANSIMNVSLAVFSNIVVVGLLILVSAIMGAVGAHVSSREAPRN